MIVVDANVAAKWYIREPGSADAAALLRQPTKRFAPAVIRLEVLATITRTVHRSRATIEESTKWCRMWSSHLEDRLIDLLRVDDLLDDAIATSLDLKHPLYDCFYLVACQRMNATLVTYDVALSRMARASSVNCELMVEPSLN